VRTASTERGKLVAAGSPLVARRRTLVAAIPALVLSALAAGGIGGCSPPSPRFNAVDITGAQYAQALRLPDHTGAERTLADYKGKVVAIFFGFTHCPDVCPTALARMAEVMKLLGADAGNVQVLFVTLDPERDTAEVLGQYVPAFHPSFVGLRGEPAATAEVAREFKVFYQKSPGATPENYSVDHTTFTYLYDPSGRIRLLVKHDAEPAKIAEDIRTLLRSA
jgi:protein SCO1/2